MRTQVADSSCKRGSREQAAAWTAVQSLRDSCHGACSHCVLSRVIRRLSLETSVACLSCAWCRP